MKRLPVLPDVLNCLDQDRLETRLIDLIDIYSPSSAEGPILSYIAEELHGQGITFYRQSVTETLYNLIAVLGQGEPGFFLLGHVDTIPRHHRESHKAHRSDDIIEGLGASDMKSGVAAMLEALFALKQAGYPDDAPAIAVGLLVDEEDGGTGIERFVQEYRPAMAIVGEPTQLKLCSLHYSYCELRLYTEGHRVHSAIPELGHNAIWDMMQLVQRLYALEPPLDNNPEHWGYFNLREMRSDNADFVVPAQCSAWIDIHLHPDVSLSAFRERVEAEMHTWEQESERATLEYEWPMSFEGFQLKKDEPVVQLAHQAARDLGWKSMSEVFRSHSDANLLAQHGTRCLVVGPGSLSTAHTVDEFVTLSDLHNAAQFYASMALGFANWEGSR